MWPRRSSPGRVQPKRRILRDVLNEHVHSALIAQTREPLRFPQLRLVRHARVSRSPRASSCAVFFFLSSFSTTSLLLIFRTSLREASLLRVTRRCRTPSHSWYARPGPSGSGQASSEGMPRRAAKPADLSKRAGRKLARKRIDNYLLRFQKREPSLLVIYVSPVLLVRHRRFARADCSTQLATLVLPNITSSSIRMVVPGLYNDCRIVQRGFKPAVHCMLKPGLCPFLLPTLSLNYW